MLDALKLKRGIKVDFTYTKARKDKKIPYDMTDDGLVNPNPTDSDIWNTTPKNNRFIVLSLGGNDVAIHKNFFISHIITKIKEVITHLLEETKISSRQFAYLIPYTPTVIMEKKITEGLKESGQKINAKQFYKNMVLQANQMCKDLDIQCISLEHFTDKERYGNLIPEPTKKGAKDIADLIVKWIEEEKEIKYW
jgi:ferritin-like metal-binding protein YciE